MKLRLAAIAAIAAGIVFTAALVHVGWSAALAGWTIASYDHRIPNLGKIKDPAGNWRPMVSIFAADAGRTDRTTIALVGSSFTFGFPQPQSVIFSSVLQRLSRDADVLNISIAAADQTGLAIMVGCALADTHRRFDILLLELPILNDNPQARNVLSSGGKLNRDLDLRSCRMTGERSWFEYFLRRPYGVQWIPLLRDESFLQTQPRRLQFPPDYIVDASTYERIASEIANTREGYVALMSRFARKTIVYPSLIQVDALVEHGFDRANIKRQIADALAACRKVESVICLDPTELASQPDLHQDAAHLNTRGHKLFGEWLHRNVRPLLETPAG